ncbi:MAG: bifunctional UDP-N-acetylmuramoyl-tripeptide:D-alanyl-D-alanine ligase/alanine racemase [Bacteroidetes bacterium]|nr:bifunctional UDP-N-acetylmuramoyl-tripeptide:D-alanyl-D-alanine ligase/alanine racemase [Bacteroidota bacterium]
MMLFSELERIGDGKITQLAKDRPIDFLIIDSRKTLLAERSVFFAIAGSRNDGHQHIAELYQLGIRQFVVEKQIDQKIFPEANFFFTGSSVAVLQFVAAAHRKRFNLPVVAITGSNGKTIIKEWLYQLLSTDYNIVKNPGSYNSQVGVPLSVWAMQPFHNLGIFEAGISRPGEMEKLEKIIQPTVGIFSNIGSAHDEGFENVTEKINEKLKLFSQTKILIYCADHMLIDAAVKKSKIKSLSWGIAPTADILVTKTDSGYYFQFKGKSFSLSVPFSDKASIENVLHCIALMLYLKYDAKAIQKRIAELKSISMRLQLKEGINQCQLIDDTYNNDLAGFQISLDFLNSHQKKKKTLVLSDILQSGMSDSELTKNIFSMIEKSGINRFIGIGSALFSNQKFFTSISSNAFYRNTNDFLNECDFDSFENEVVLVKGARAFQFEKIVHRLQRKVHGTIMEIDLGKLVYNLNYFKSKLKPEVRLMAMVKAFAYGSGSEEVANLLQYHKVDYLGVAYADEGVELRKKNISLPIMVMNSSEESFESLLLHDLEPVIFNLKTLQALIHFLNHRECKIHLELETGMNRLGFNESELNEAISVLNENKNLKIKSVFSHLSGADEKMHDAFSQQQFAQYQKMYETISSSLNVNPLRHILNSAGILRFPNFQMDMVRLGIGLYGVDPTEEKNSPLLPAATLKTTISQLKKIKPGETIGYGRKGKAEQEMTVATLAIGYADGFSRGFSKGVGLVLVNGKKAPVIGNVCMDMTMVDVTGIEVVEGDQAVIFGDGLSIHEVAARIGTIPYEILTNTSERVKRVFVSEGI